MTTTEQLTEIKQRLTDIVRLVTNLERSIANDRDEIVDAALAQKTKHGKKIRAWLDTRLAKKNGKYPLKMRVWDKRTSKARLITVGYDFTVSEFEEAERTGEIDQIIEDHLNGTLF